MRGASTLIPARFLTLVGHLCVLITLLWESQESVRHCLQNHQQPIMMRYYQTENYIQNYQNRLVAGFSVSIAFIFIELTTFILGITMFSLTVSLISISAHGSAAILLTYFVLDVWPCDWYWPIFVICSLLPVTDKDNSTAEDLKPRWSFYLVLAGIATTLGSSLPVGYNIGVINTPAELIKSFCNESVIAHYNVVLDEQRLDVLWSAVVSTFIVGGCTGSLLGAVLADWLGRKKATIATSVLWMAGALMFLLCRTANSVEMLIFGRLLVGLSGGLTTSIVPMYLTELSPGALTGAMGVACPMGVNVGVLVGQVMGLDFLLGGVNDWPYLLSFYALLVIICLPMLWVLPESPKYLLVVRRDEESALKELSRLRGVSLSVLGEELESLRAEARSDEDQAWGLLAVLKERRFLLPLLLVCSMQAGQQTSGINAVFYYSQSIFRQAGLSVAGAQYATIGCGFINVCTALAMLRLLPRCGRRPLFLGSVLAAALILAALAAALKFMDVVSWMPYVCMIAVLLYVLVYGFGLGPIPYFIASEIFEVSSRSAGMSWGSLANWAGNFAVGMSFPSARAALGPYCFLIFAAITAALYVFHRKYLPETLGRTPAQVTELCARSLRNAHAQV